MPKTITPQPPADYRPPPPVDIIAGLLALTPADRTLVWRIVEKGRSNADEK